MKEKLLIKAAPLKIKREKPGQLKDGQDEKQQSTEKNT